MYARPLVLENIDPDAVKVLRRLTRAGHTAYLVGGSVRDLLLGRTPKDFDIGTSARPSEVRALFRNCRVIGRRFRLAHVLFGGGKIIEVATFRRDPRAPEHVGEDGLEPSAEHAEERGFAPAREDEDADLLIRHDNVFGAPHEDAQRRDFTINGLFYDIERGEVIDYVGGMEDVEDGVVRTIRRPAIRLREDPIRILRAVKFAARLDMDLEPELHEAMFELRYELERAAKPRLLEEIFRLLRGGAATASIRLAWDLGILSVILPELSAFLDDQAAGSTGSPPALWGRLDAIDRRQREGALPNDTVLFAALLLDPLEEWLDGMPDLLGAFDEFFGPLNTRLIVPRKIRDRLRMLVLSQPRLRAGRLGSLPRRDFFADAVLLHQLDREARGLAAAAWEAEQLTSPTDGPEPGAAGRRRGRRRRGRGPRGGQNARS